MKTYIQVKDGTYTLVDNGTMTELKIVQPKGWDPTLELPENSTGRKLVNVPNLEKHLDSEGRFELKAKAPRIASTEPKAPKSPTKKWYEWLSEEDQAILHELEAKAEAAKQAHIEAEKAIKNSPLEKARRAAEAAEARAAKLRAEYEAAQTKTINESEDLGDLDSEEA